LVTHAPYFLPESVCEVLDKDGVRSNWAVKEACPGDESPDNIETISSRLAKDRLISGAC
jgi:hypothetical protein